jgi:hypothetical protein
MNECYQMRHTIVGIGNELAACTLMLAQHSMWCAREAECSKCLDITKLFAYMVLIFLFEHVSALGSLAKAV